MITSILEKSLVIIAALIIAVSVAIIYFRSKNSSRKELLELLKKAKYFNVWIIVITLIYTAVFGVFNHINLRQSIQAIISLNYSEASQAQNSNGTRFNMAEILSDEVLEKAIKKGAFPKVTVKQLKNCLSVYPCVQGNVGSENEYHISTEYAIDYHASKHTSHLDAENVIKLITAAYKEYYIEKYTDNFSLDLPEQVPDFKTLEYMDTASYLEKEASSILNYLYGMAEKNPSFITSTNTTFNAIAGRVYQFRETQLNQNLRSLILQNGIAKDKTGYIERLSQRNNEIDFDRQKNFTSFSLCNEAVERYAEEMTRIVLVPTWDQTGKYYMGRTKVGIDELSVQAASYSDRVASNEKEIMDNNLVISKLKDSSDDQSIKETADELINSSFKTIKAFEKEAITAGREYSNHKMNQCISVSVYAVSLMSELKKLIIFAMLSYIALLLCSISHSLVSTTNAKSGFKM